MSKLNEEESEKTIQGKKWKIIDWKNRPDTCTIIGGEKSCNNKIEIFVNGEFDVEKDHKD